MKYAMVNIVWAKSHGIEVLPEMRTSTDQSKVGAVMDIVDQVKKLLDKINKK